MSNLSFMFSATTAAAGCWIIDTYLFTPICVAVDTDNNTYHCGTISGDIYLIKISNSGNITWQYKLDSTFTDTVTKVAVDSAKNVYVIGTTTVNSATSGFIAKYNSSGILQWQKALPNTRGTAELTGIAIDFSNYIYTIGSKNEGASSYLFFSKYDTNGNQVFSKTITGAPISGVDLAVSASNIYLLGRISSAWVVIKYTTTGTYTWQRQYAQTTSCLGNAIAIDSSENIYVAGTLLIATTYNCLALFKINTDGTYVWGTTRKISATNYNHSFSDITIDSSNDIYVIGYSNLVCCILKYTPNAVITWERSFNITNSTSTRGYSVVISYNNYMYITGQGFGSTSFIAKLPKNGTKTGSYPKNFPYVYAASNLISGVVTSSTYFTTPTFVKETDFAQWIVASGLTTTVNEIPRTIAIDSLGNTYMGGSVSSGKCYLVKFDFNGAFQWHRTLSGSSDIIFRIVIDNDNSVLVAGVIYNSTLRKKPFVARFSSTGTLLWLRYINVPVYNSTINNAQGLSVDSFGDIYVAGSYTPDGSNSSMFVAKLNSSGELIWQNTVTPETGRQAGGQGLARDLEGNIYVGGHYGLLNAWYPALWKYDTNGNLIFSKQYQVSSSYSRQHETTDVIYESGSIYMSGNSSNSSAIYNGSVLKISLNGTIASHKILSSSATTNINGICGDKLGNIYTASLNTPSTGVTVIQIDKLDSALTNLNNSSITTNAGTNSHAGRAIVYNNGLVNFAAAVYIGSTRNTDNMIGQTEFPLVNLTVTAGLYTFIKSNTAAPFVTQSSPTVVNLTAAIPAVGTFTAVSGFTASTPATVNNLGIINTPTPSISVSNLTSTISTQTSGRTDI